MEGICDEHHRLRPVGGHLMEEEDDGQRVGTLCLWGEAIWHREAVGGWSLKSLQAVKTAGGIGASSAAFKINSEFDYQGTFDPGGFGWYFNTHQTKITINTQGVWTCVLDAYGKNIPPWWRWVAECGS